ncbi:polysaccharide lyase [Clohesyomyces aquaticus]|uniref:Polysaccharide lyase n=1 Tax=Clohesyomyces aquaticus TaxID=1231657 RepID=A0A1Y2A051_9PLEO|nr:polysaccharide lyase [Clohesyomyces aquaticus]
MVVKILTLGLAALALPVAHAVPEFTNHGTLNGWPKPKPEAQGTVDEVTNVVFRGGTALKMTQTYIPGYQDRYHSEVVYDKGYKRGQTKFYGFAFRLSEKWQFDPPQNYNLAQWIADFNDVKPCPTCQKCDDWSPTSMVFVVGRKLYTRVKTGTLVSGKPCDQHIKEIPLLDGLVGDKWYRMTFEVMWKSDETGKFRVWVDKNIVYNKTNIATTLLDDGRDISFRVGLYANGWHDDNHTMAGTQGFRQVWYDEIGIGSELKDADPDVL